MKPETGTIVEIKSRKGSCSCQGYTTLECYYDGTFNGIRDQSWVDQWRVSPNNDLLKDLESRKCVIATGCENCIA
tara:strand:+ start:586 stop:810 length:225 start_codon:yes stop_codon:yes gene_type:complete